jgi:hypothetical protein
MQIITKRQAPSIPGNRGTGKCNAGRGALLLLPPSPVGGGRNNVAQDFDAALHRADPMRRGSGREWYRLGDGFAEARNPVGVFVFCDCASRARHFALNSEMVTSFTATFLDHGAQSKGGRMRIPRCPPRWRRILSRQRRMRWARRRPRRPSGNARAACRMRHRRQ